MLGQASLCLRLAVLHDSFVLVLFYMCTVFHRLITVLSQIVVFTLRRRVVPVCLELCSARLNIAQVLFDGTRDAGSRWGVVGAVASPTGKGL